MRRPRILAYVWGKIFYPTFVKQKFDDGLVSMSGRQVERGQAGLGQEVGIGSVVDEQPRNLGVAVSARQMKRGNSTLEKKIESSAMKDRKC